MAGLCAEGAECCPGCAAGANSSVMPYSLVSLRGMQAGTIALWTLNSPAAATKELPPQKLQHWRRRGKFCPSVLDVWMWPLHVCFCLVMNVWRSEDNPGFPSACLTSWTELFCFTDAYFCSLQASEILLCPPPISCRTTGIADVHSQLSMSPDIWTHHVFTLV